MSKFKSTFIRIFYCVAVFAIILTFTYFLFSRSCFNNDSTASVNGFKSSYEDSVEIDRNISEYQAPSVKSEQYYIVYVSKNGKIHKDYHCSGMKYYTAMRYEEAVAAGYSFCQKCY